MSYILETKLSALTVIQLDVEFSFNSSIILEFIHAVLM